MLVKNSFDDYATRSNVRRQLSEDYDTLLKIKSLIIDGGQILDVGCGDGTPIASYFINKGYGYTGIDISEKRLKIAKEITPEGNFLPMDMREINFLPNHFDIVLCINSIIHVDRLEHRKIFDSFYHILKPGGILFLSMGPRERDEIRPYWKDIPMYWSQFGTEYNLNILRDTGFVILNVENKIFRGNEIVLYLAAKQRSTKEQFESHEIYVNNS